MHTGDRPFPHLYESALEWPGEGPAAATAGVRTAILSGPPPEFGGQATWWSPEHLLLSALNACLMATFGAMARARELPVHWYSSRARATLSKTPGGLAFTHLGVSVTVRTDEADAVRAKETLLKAKQRCIVGNVLLLPVQLDVTVETVGRRQPAAPQPAAEREAVLP